MYSIGKEITKENILAQVSELDILKYYIESMDAPYTSFRSELRQDDNPSCQVFITSGGRFLYTDFGTGESMDCFEYVMKLFGYGFGDALRRINIDFNLKLGRRSDYEGKVTYRDSPGVASPLSFAHRDRPVFQIRIRKWSRSTDLPYWGRYHLTVRLLRHYRVLPITHLWVDGYLSAIEHSGSPMYAYSFGDGMYKILRPFEPKEHKWRTNAHAGVLQGYAQLHKRGRHLVITKSLKDVMVLHRLGISAVAPQAESVMISPDRIMELKGHFDNLYVLYDNDDTGIEHSMELSRLYDIPELCIPVDTGAKDISDYCALYGLTSSWQLITHMINGSKKHK